MSKRINGVVCTLIDVVYDDDFIYDVYESPTGKIILIISGER